jgi:hypothetical protein
MINNKAAKLAIRLSEWDWRSLRDYLVHLVKEAEQYNLDNYSAAIYGTSRSIDFCKPNAPILTDSFWYDRIIKLINVC